MAEGEQQPNRPFDDYIHSTTDESITNLSQNLNKKVDIPSGLAANKALIFNSSTNRFEASLISNASIDPAAAISVSKLAPGTNGDVLTTQSGIAVWNSNMLKLYAANASGALALTTTVTDVASATVTFSVNTTNNMVLILGVFGFSATATGYAQAQGIVNIDGVDNTLNAFFGDTGAAINTTTVPVNVSTSGLSVGSHTIKLRAKKALAGGTVSAAATVTTIRVLVFDP